MIQLVAMALLAAAPAPEPAPASGSSVVLVWGGGKTSEVALEWRKRWDEERAAIDGLVEFADGFPKTVASADVPGLNPGFEIVILGFCGAEEAAETRQLLEALFPFVYEKPVQVDAAACPRWARQVEKLEAVIAPKSKAARLSAVSVKVSATPGEDGSATTRVVSIVARDASGKLLGRHRVEDDAHPTGTGCETKVSAGNDDVVLRRRCTWQVGAYCNRYPGEESRINVRAGAGGLAISEKVLSKWDINFDKDCAE